MNIYPILTIFLYNPTPFLARWIVTKPTKRLLPLLLKNKQCLSLLKRSFHVGWNPITQEKTCILFFQNDKWHLFGIQNYLCTLFPTFEGRLTLVALAFWLVPMSPSNINTNVIHYQCTYHQTKCNRRQP
jgi:hypothetical protein